ncbi:HU family DNA-binding protein [Pseudoalteromonas luteoviolacea]|uniref:Transcriptional regulator n=1 Tax=Pseudoalteromonas luteoviolacea S4054 TaxID=1129367 RepID=A0A0F6A3K6_9GAMM|nr:HU family DNA-binding protein [Pseudoalteromonas luteoviolacea]AOT08952.1 DNA-binding protein [Pseudoalteromonas luteoviolacea]AOT13864.1 DNA-binding protein [Pseudoalteromonas luteoviolacea]AOT18779.1 DNA-binding protein [Pseudoalteromonas luteoviolacea]KKE80800.1 transcriptional regulator [Pseudoalteromonas luteoviolacea S4054]KZN70986.1 transcriptional regulator [Pseudoalteromonas luteoviolacea S4047-1]
MNKSELVSAMSERNELTKKDSKAALDSILNAITKRLSEGDPVALSGFGTLTLSYHPAKAGRNPKTGEEIIIEGQNKVLFKPAKAFKDALAD